MNPAPLLAVIGRSEAERDVLVCLAVFVVRDLASQLWRILYLN